MAMILDAVMNRCTTLLVDAAFEEVSVVLGVKDEVQKLLRKMESIRSLLKDAEKRKINESSINLWLSELKDFMYDADDIIDLCKIKANQLLADDENSENYIFRVCCNLSSTLSSFVSSVSLRRGIGKRIKDLNVRLQQIDENRNKFNLQQSEILESPRIPLFNPRQSGPLADPLVVGEEVEVAANDLVNNLLITGEVVDEERCRIFAVAGMGGIGKTTLAQKIFNHPDIKNYFSLKVWVTVSQTYSETELLMQLIRGAKKEYGAANTKEELQLILRDSVASGQILFLVLDDVWSAGVWVDLLRVPLQTAKASVRVLVTTRNEAVAKAMKAAYTHNVEKLSTGSSWDMLRKLVFFSDEEEQLWDELKELGIDIVRRCGGLPLAIKAIAGVLNNRERTKKEWENIIRSDAWSIRDLHEDHIAALHLSFEDLPSHLKQCFLYFSLFGEDEDLYRDELARLWVAEGFITENVNEGSLMEDVAEKYFNELLGRNLLLWDSSSKGRKVHDDPDTKAFFWLRDTFINDGSICCKMHDLVRSLVIFLSKEETSYGDASARSSTTFIKPRRLLIESKYTAKAKYAAKATDIFDLVAKQGALRTLLASFSGLLLNEERLKCISCLRVLDISWTSITELPDSIGDLVHLRYLNLSDTGIRAIPESIAHLSCLQFLDIYFCCDLKRLPNGITQLCSLRYLDMRYTRIKFMPIGIEKLQQLNWLEGFPLYNNDTSSKLEDLNSLKQLRNLRITNLERAQCEEITLKKLPHLSHLALSFSDSINDRSEEQKLAAEELFDKIIPPQSLEKLCIKNFFGRRFPNWMASTCFENYVPNLTELILAKITSCAELPALGHLSKLRNLSIQGAKKVKKIDPEFFNAVAFPKLESLIIARMYELEELSFDAPVEVNASPRLKILPCLYELYISKCPLLKQLPEGLKYSPMKSLTISTMKSLKYVEDLPSVEKLHLHNIKHLERVYYLPMLKKLIISYCPALSCVEELNSLQNLEFDAKDMKFFPNWLLVFLQQPGLQNKQDFVLNLTCRKNVLQRCLKGGSYWELVKQIPQIIAKSYTAGDIRSYLHYNKHLNIYKAKISDED